MMESKKRREELINILKNSNVPIAGSELSKRLGVSRQVIVQDIALLRAVNKNIISTTKGYMLYSHEEDKCNRTFLVKHTDEEIQDELYTIVDYGGKVLDVIVEHGVYGSITVDLIIRNRLDVDEFLKNISNSNGEPLNKLTNGVHIHTVEADSEDVLDVIEQQLLEKGYIIK